MRLWIWERHITVSAELSGYSDWPGLKQVFQLTRKATIKKTGEVREETVFTPEEASPSRLLELVRCHYNPVEPEN